MEADGWTLKRYLDPDTYNDSEMNRGDEHLMLFIRGASGGPTLVVVATSQKEFTEAQRAEVKLVVDQATGQRGDGSAAKR